MSWGRMYIYVIGNWLHLFLMVLNIKKLISINAVAIHTASENLKQDARLARSQWAKVCTFEAFKSHGSLSATKQQFSFIRNLVKQQYIFFEVGWEYANYELYRKQIMRGNELLPLPYAILAILNEIVLLYCHILDKKILICVQIS